MPWRTALVGITLGIALLAACSEDPAPQPPPPATPAAPPGLTLPADMPPLNCADFAAPPLRLDPPPKIVGRKCANPDGSTLWGAAVYQCVDGTVWPIFQRDPGPAQEPVTPEFDKCVGRTTFPLQGERKA